MGLCLNPGNVDFKTTLNSDYVDKSGIIALINDTIGTRRKLTLISRARRFGKTVTAQKVAETLRKCKSF